MEAFSKKPPLQRRNCQLKDIRKIIKKKGNALVSMKLTEQLGKYFDWADQIILDILKSLTEEEFNRQMGNYNRSIRSICLHLTQDHWWWYHYITEKGFDNRPDFPNMTKTELLDSLASYRNKWLELIKKQPFETFNMRRQDKTVPLSFEELIFHINNHATYHRGQLVLGLRMLGKEVPMTDYIPFKVSMKE